ncbi:MAG: hypothetical protein J3Q66DRAFT_443690 [Benniella sp.]|nr:MAG: hypothetical protein J3Q66DRAFT_443690 [Benniella sp.]
MYRIVAAGTQNGTLNVGIIPKDPITLKLDHLQIKTHTAVLFAPITILAVFTRHVLPGGKNMRRRKRSSSNRGDTEDIGPEAEGQGLDEQQHKDNDVDNDDCNNEHEKEAMAIHLLVTCAIEQAFCLQCIIKHGFGQRSDLVECSYHDSILATHIMDADWDGSHEIMVGTYGRQLMVFKELSPGQRPYSMETNMVPNIPSIPGRQHQQQQQHNHHPDLNNDGLEELVITTLNGVSLFLPDSLAAKRRLTQVIERIQEIEEMKKMVEGLWKSNQELFEAAATAQRLKEQAEEGEEKQQMEAETQEGAKKTGESEEGKETERPEEAATEITADGVKSADSLPSQQSSEATIAPELHSGQSSFEVEEGTLDDSPIYSDMTAVLELKESTVRRKMYMNISRLSIGSIQIMKPYQLSLDTKEGIRKLTGNKSRQPVHASNEEVSGPQMLLMVFARMVSSDNERKTDTPLNKGDHWKKNRRKYVPRSVKDLVLVSSNRAPHIHSYLEGARESCREKMRHPERNKHMSQNSNKKLQIYKMQFWKVLQGQYIPVLRMAGIANELEFSFSCLICEEDNRSGTSE